MILGINKPSGMTSHDVVNIVRKISKEKRVGHGGTLDPFASGVLVVGITRDSTKKLHNILKNTDKEYIATLELGKISTTGDTEGEITTSGKEKEMEKITKKVFEKNLQKFIGYTKQIPPAHSAVKIKGVPSYKLARAGKKASLPKRKVLIKELELLDFRPPGVTIRIVASSGTYVRSLAMDIGKKLGVGAYLTRLVRTRVGEFTIEKSASIDELEEKLNPHT